MVSRLVFIRDALHLIKKTQNVSQLIRKLDHKLVSIFVLLWLRGSTWHVKFFIFFTKFLRAYEFTQRTSVRKVENNTNTRLSNKWIKVSKSSQNIYASRKNDKNVVVARRQLSTAESGYFTFVFSSLCVCFVNFIYLFFNVS